ncbi:twin-arginine translocation signal domain-containing protein [Methylibium sp.]|uniref:twin-arginine translocation signal domain-containing protein n=1 Tax=Methylibium sp. TaxID=2067992 RepID=UPI003D14F711
MKTIAISLSVPTGECKEDDGRVPKLDLPLSRRELLKGSGVLMGTLVSGSLLAALAPSPVWAVPMRKLSDAEGRALLTMGRVLYPHKKLEDAVYALLVKDLDAKAAADPKVAKLLKEGVARLDRLAGGRFENAASEKQLSIVRSIEATPFFATVRGQCITSLYDNDMAFAALGYPGSAWEKGGYITRGFQDLTWLPAPPTQASPPPHMG